MLLQGIGIIGLVLGYGVAGAKYGKPYDSNAGISPLATLVIIIGSVLFIFGVCKNPTP